MTLDAVYLCGWHLMPGVAFWSAGGSQEFEIRLGKHPEVRIRCKHRNLYFFGFLFSPRKTFFGNSCFWRFYWSCWFMWVCGEKRNLLISKGLWFIRVVDVVTQILSRAVLLTLDPNTPSRENSVVQKALPNSVFTSSVIHTQMPLPGSNLASHFLAPILPHMLRHYFPSDVVFASSQFTLSFSTVQSPIPLSSILSVLIFMF